MEIRDSLLEVRTTGLQCPDVIVIAYCISMNILLCRIRPFLSSLRQAFSIVWQSSPSLAVASIIVRVIQAFLPLAVLYLTKLLIDAVTEVLKAPSAEATMTRMTILLDWQLSQ